MDASTLEANMSEALKALGHLEIRPKVDDWGTKVLFVYETLWCALEDDRVAATDCDTLARLLNDPEVFALARNVIPELRDTREAAKLRAQPKIMFLARVQAAVAPPQPEADATDSAMFMAEKNAVYDADAYRTMLFLRRSERFDEKEMDAIREWLDKCPVKVTKEQGAEDRDS